jgi:hypothetical protein
MGEEIQKLMEYWEHDQRWLNGVVAAALKEAHKTSGHWAPGLHFECDSTGVTIEAVGGKIHYTWLRVGKFVQEYIANGK